MKEPKLNLTLILIFFGIWIMITLPFALDIYYNAGESLGSIIESILLGFIFLPLVAFFI